MGSDSIALGQRCPGSNEKIPQQPLRMIIVIIIIDIIIIFVNNSYSSNDRFANVLLAARPFISGYQSNLQILIKPWKINVIISVSGRGN